MPQDKMMFVRPINCHVCGHGYHALGHAKEYAAQHGRVIIDIEKEQANKDPVYAAIDTHDPKYFYGFGHGNVNRYTGDSEEDIFTSDECDKLANRNVYLLSCLTANQLGPAIVEAGAESYAGFNISWTWITASGTDGDPYDDPYAYGFYESANELWNALVDGKTMQQAVQASVDRYNSWIDYWYYDNPNDPYSQEMIKWLLWDRNGLVLLTICDTLTDEVSCRSHGCSWYNGSCHTTTAAEGGFNWALLGALVLTGIVAYAVLKPAKTTIPVKS